MPHAFQFITRHGYTLLFLWVLVEQLGIPIPSIPLLLAVGALAATGHFSLGLALLLPLLAGLLADTVWFYMGRHKGHAVLKLMCRISLEPDSCVRRTENLFVQHGVRALWLAKFIPGLSTMAPPLAGLMRVRLARFLLHDGAGILLWAASFVGAGFFFSAQLAAVAQLALRLGGSLLALALLSLAGYIALKFYQRWRLLKRLRIARITAVELKQRLDAGEAIVVVDLRHSLELDPEADQIPGALRLAPDELETRHGEIARDRDVVLYCT